MNFMTLDPSVRWTIAGIGGLLVLASVIVASLIRLKPNSDFSSLRQRVNSWWVMVAVFTLAMSLNRNVSIGFFAFVSFLTLKEYLSLIPTRRADRRVLFWAYLAIPAQFYLVYLEWYGLFIIFIPVYMFLLLPLRMVVLLTWVCMEPPLPVPLQMPLVQIARFISLSTLLTVETAMFLHGLSIIFLRTKHLDRSVEY